MTQQAGESMIRAMPTDAVSKKLFTVEEYHRMWDAGIFPENRRFELIRGEIIEMPLLRAHTAGASTV